MSKWLVAFAILAVCAFLLGLGVDRGFPAWLQYVGWAFLLLFLFGGIGRLIWLSTRQRRFRFGELACVPQSWRRWILDEPAPAKKPEPGR
ncbi:MAG TPA: hypothetical protein VG844_05505 [Terracidiphilus sp.]|nr:hypothetical protein [Terracidiphilus sp.]